MSKFNLPKGCAFSDTAIIPARGDIETRVSFNLHEVEGVSLLARAVDFCHNLGIKPVVSSDSKDLLKHVKDRSDADCILRPAALAAPEIDSKAVLKHAVEMMGIQDYWTLLLEPTSPWRYADDVQRCLDEAHSDRWIVTTVDPVKTVRGVSARFNGVVWLLGPLDSWFSNEVTQVVFTDYRPNIKSELEYHIASNAISWHRKFHAEWLQAYMDSVRSQTEPSPQTTHKAPESSQ